MSHILISVDVEASGPAPRQGDLLSFGCVVIEPSLSHQFYSGFMKPECGFYDEGAYKAIGVTREQHENAPSSIENQMLQFEQWVTNLTQIWPGRRIVMVSDNPGFDFMWMTFECWDKLGYNPFGHSARRIGDVWSGLRGRYIETQGWKKLRKTKHTHNALDDALGNAEAWLAMWEQYGDNAVKKEIRK